MDKSFYRTLAGIAVPITVQNFLQSTVNLLDNVMVGQLGGVEIAAVGLGNQIFFVLNLILFGIASGGGVFIAQYWGKKDLKGIHRTMGIMLCAAFIISLLFSLVSFFVPELLLSLYSHDQSVVSSGSEYLKIASLGYICFSLTMVFGIALRSCGEVKLPLVATIVSLILNTVLNYIFIFILGWGVRGAALGTIIARFAEFFIIFGGAYKKKLPLAAKLSEFLDFGRTDLASFLKIAFPVIINETLWGLGITIENAIYARVSTEALAAFNITATIQMLVWVIFIGIGNGGSVMIGNKIGEGNEKLAREYATRFCRLMVFTALITGWIMIPLGKLLPYLYNVDSEIIRQATYMLIAIMIYYPFKAFNMIMIVGVLRAGGDTVYAGIADIGGLWGVGLVFGSLAAFVFGFEPWMIFAAFSCEEILKLCMNLPRLKSGKWLHNVT